MKPNQVYFEAVVCSESGNSLFAKDVYLHSDNLQQFVPSSGRGIQAATILQSLGFKVQHIGTFSISAEGPQELWEKVFSTQVEQKSQPFSQASGLPSPTGTR